MTDKPDPEIVEILVDELGSKVREHVRKARGNSGQVVIAAKESLNALASVGAMIVSGMPTSAGGFDFFLDAFRAQIAANIEHKMNPQTRRPNP